MKVKYVFKRVLSILSLTIGVSTATTTLIGNLAILLILFRDGRVDSFSIAAMAFLLLIAIAFISGGIILWEFKQKRMVLKIVLTTIGGLLIISSIVQLLMGTNSLVDVLDPIMLIASLVILGAIFLLFGFRLIAKPVQAASNS